MELEFSQMCSSRGFIKETSPNVKVPTMCLLGHAFWFLLMCVLEDHARP